MRKCCGGWKGGSGSRGIRGECAGGSGWRRIKLGGRSRARFPGAEGADAIRVGSDRIPRQRVQNTQSGDRQLVMESTMLQLTLLVEEEATTAKRPGWPLSTDAEIRKAVLVAVAVLLRDRPSARVEWTSSRSIPLDGKPWFGRCAVCQCWVFDCEAPSEMHADGVSRGAKIDGRFRCDEHLPPVIGCASRGKATMSLFRPLGNSLDDGS
jgi:hypothetical protein